MEVGKWATPRSSEADRGTCPSEMARRSPGIKAQAERFPTPQGYSFDKSHAPGQTTLDMFVRENLGARSAFPTPVVSDAKASGGTHLRPRHGSTLTDVAIGRGTERGVWNTPEAHNAKGCRGMGCSLKGDLGKQATSEFRSGHQDQETATSGDGSSNEDQTSRHPSKSIQTPTRLNPRFVEWLMGLPIGWSTATIGSGCSETEWYQWLLDALCCICSLERQKEVGDEIGV